MQLSAKKVGIIGCGNTGSEVLALLAPFGCHIFVNDIRDISGLIAQKKKEAYNIQLSSKKEIYQNCDFISLHVPLTKQTKNMIHRNVLAAMKKTSYLINTSRGSIIKEDDLVYALRRSWIAGAALDVFAKEPLCNAKLLNLPNLVFSPHIGGNSKEAVLAMGRAAIEHLRAYSQARQFHSSV